MKTDKNELMINIGAFFFCIGFMEWLFAVPALGVLLYYVIDSGEYLGLINFFAALAVWVGGILWFKLTDAKRVAAYQAKKRAACCTEFEITSARYGVLRFEHYNYKIGCTLISPAPAIFPWQQEAYTLYFAGPHPDPAYITKQLDHISFISDLIIEKLMSRLVSVCDAIGLPLEGTPTGFMVKSISLPPAKKQEIILYGCFLGIREHYCGEAAFLLGERSIRTEIDYDTDKFGDRN